VICIGPVDNAASLTAESLRGTARRRTTLANALSASSETFASSINEAERSIAAVTSTSSRRSANTVAGIDNALPCRPIVAGTARKSSATGQRRIGVVGNVANPASRGGAFNRGGDFASSEAIRNTVAGIDNATSLSTDALRGTAKEVERALANAASASSETLAPALTEAERSIAAATAASAMRFATRSPCRADFRPQRRQRDRSH